MRKHYVFLLLLYLTSFVSAQDSMIAGLQAKKDSVPQVRSSCRATINNEQHPLVVVDGSLSRYDTLEKFDVNTIASIDILKDSVAKALFGSRGYYGVVIITTRTGTESTFRALDEENNTALAGATFTFMADERPDSIRLIADHSGRVSVKELKPGKEYHLVITSVGYKQFSTVIRSERKKREEVYRLTRDVQEDAAVIVTGYGGRWCHSSCCVIASRSRHVKLLSPVQSSRTISVFPNPVVKGNSVHVEYEVSDDQVVNIKLFSLNGAQMSSMVYHSAKGNNRAEVAVSSRWAAGVYVIQVTDITGKTTRQQKIIIQ